MDTSTYSAEPLMKKINTYFIGMHYTDPSHSSYNKNISNSAQLILFCSITWHADTTDLF